VKTHLKIPSQLLEDIHRDLSRPHAFAAERVGFLTCGIAAADGGGQILLGHRWHSVADEDYLDNPRVGAAIGGSAFRKVLQYAYSNPVSILHVHRHDHRGAPRFSLTDLKSAKEYVPSFFNVQRAMPHGIVVLSFDNASGQVWDFGRPSARLIDVFQIVGYPMRKWA
jgi:hypothetical protein